MDNLFVFLVELEDIPDLVLIFEDGLLPLLGEEAPADTYGLGGGPFMHPFSREWMRRQRRKEEEDARRQQEDFERRRAEMVREQQLRRLAHGREILAQQRAETQPVIRVPIKSSLRQLEIQNERLRNLEKAREAQRRRR